MLNKLVLLVFLSICFNALGQSSADLKLQIGASIGKSFLSYGDVWGTDRSLSINYGEKWFVGFEYGYADYESNNYSEDFYREQMRTSVVTSNGTSFLGYSPVKFAFGYKTLDVIDRVSTINSYQLQVGRRFNLFSPRLQLSLFGNVGIYKFSVISSDFIVSGIDLYNPNFIMDDVTIVGTFLNRFLDVAYGFGSEVRYEILKDKLILNLSANASLGDVRWFTIGLGTNFKI